MSVSLPSLNKMFFATIFSILPIIIILCTCYRLAPGVDPRAIQGHCKMGFPPGVGEFNKTKFPWSIASQQKILLISTSYYWDSLLKYRIYPCIMRTFFTTFEAEKLRCALYTEPFVSEALLICINKRNNSRWLFPGLLL